MEWRNISTAPKDGRAILTYAPGGEGDEDWDDNINTRQVYGRQISYWGDESHSDVKGGAWIAFWADNSGGEYSAIAMYSLPTHWMPLPAPPSNSIIVEA